MTKKSLEKFLLNAQAQHQPGSYQHKAKPSPILAIDYGEKFCGFAWSPDGVTALILNVVPTNQALSTIESILEKKQIRHIIFGLPLAPDGGENHICDRIKQFAQTLKTDSQKIRFINERGSSKNTIKQKKQRIDDQAALNILQYYLDS